MIATLAAFLLFLAPLPADKVTYHFVLLRDGGAIEVQANSPQDEDTRVRIRKELYEVSRQFGKGDFSSYLMTGSKVPAEGIKEAGSAIKFEFEELPFGGRVVMRTENSEARKAIHKYMRHQIGAYRTGGSDKIRSN